MMRMQAEPAFDGKAFVAHLSTPPGVYRMCAGNDDLLYVGKAGNLKKRVGSYFLKPSMQPRIAAMVAQIARIEITLTRTEAEALLLEAQLIKTLRPRYNILLRDDKSYPYIHLTPGDYPRLAFHRGARNGGGRYFGPYPSAASVRETLALLHKLFRIRNCEDSYFRNRSRPCLQYQIGRCSAPCVGLITVAEYRLSAHHATLFLEGKSKLLLDELIADMEKASANLDFERAARMRDHIAAVGKVQARQFVQGAGRDLDVMACRIAEGVACVTVMSFRDGGSLGSRDFFPRLVLDSGEADVLGSFLGQYFLDRPIPPELVLSHAPEQAELLAEALAAHAGHKVELKSVVRGDRARFLEMAETNAQAALTARLASRQTLLQRFAALRELLGLAQLPQRIECFDISHTMGEATVASCVVFGPEGAEKSRYRRFNIQGITAGDDYAAMHQALERRYRRIQNGEGCLPDVLLIDGGAGQVRQALDVLATLGVEGVCVVGVAKGDGRRSGHESLILGDSGRTLWPGPGSPASHLIQSVRDEAHRFAITGHRGRREKARASSSLEAVAGVGAKRRAALLKQFGGLAGVTRAGIEELMQVKGINRELAERIYSALHG